MGVGVKVGVKVRARARARARAWARARARAKFRLDWPNMGTLVTMPQRSEPCGMRLRHLRHVALPVGSISAASSTICSGTSCTAGFRSGFTPHACNAHTVC